MKFRTTLPLVLALLVAGSVSAKTKKTAAYLFTYFTGNAPEQEQICYAVSEDGWNYTPLNDGKPIIASADIARTGCVRDPHILRGEDGWFYMVVTDMKSSLGWSSNRGMVLMRSKDLVKWQHHTIHFPERYKGTMFEHVTRVWAPQTIYDPKTKKYYLEAIFTFNTVKDASTFARTLTCEFEVTVSVSVNIIPELMDIKSLYLDMQLEHIRKMLSMTELDNKNAREYLSRLEAIFTAALDCLANRIYSEKCFSIEEELYMVLGFRFKSIESANEFAQRVTGNE